MIKVLLSLCIVSSCLASEVVISTDGKPAEIEVRVSIEVGCEVYELLLRGLDDGSVIEGSQVNRDNVVRQLNEFCGGIE